MDKHILPLDASTTSIGWLLAKGETFLEHGIYQPKGKLWHKRIIDFGNWLSDVVVLHNLHVPDTCTIVYEKATGHHGRRQGNKATDRKLGAVEYEILRVADRWGIECVEIYPKQIKSTGVSKDNLDYAQRYIERHISYFTFDRSTKAAIGRAGDLADAWGCWLAYLRKVQLASLDKSASLE